MLVLTLLLGCIYVHGHAPYDTGGSGTVGQSCHTTYDCYEGEGCLDGTCARACQSDHECPGNYACSDPSDQTDALGCVERCASDWDCKAGSRCSLDGACE